jgi:hypothetical protein
LVYCEKRFTNKNGGTMTRFYKNYSNRADRYIRLATYFFSLLIVCTLIGAPSAANAQAVETWKLVKKEYPVLPSVILEVTEGRNAGSFVKIRRTQKGNEVVYSTKSVAHGNQLCLWISGFIWDDNLPELINSGKEYLIDLEARYDRREGEDCGGGRISVTYGSRGEPLRDRAANVKRIKSGLADPDPGGIAPPISTEIFQVVARPELTDNNMFTVAIHVSDGSVADEVVALYVYEKVGTRPTENMDNPPDQNQSSGTIVKLQSMNFPDRYIMHQWYLGELAPISTEVDRQSASFKLVPGLANRDMVSFESVNFPGYYLCHQGFRIKLIQGTNTDQFKKDATFKRVPGLANSSMVSFESYNYPGYYIRHYEYHLFLEQGNTDVFRNDATFKFASFGR